MQLRYLMENSSESPVRLVVHTHYQSVDIHISGLLALNCFLRISHLGFLQLNLNSNKENI